MKLMPNDEIKKIVPQDIINQLHAADCVPTHEYRWVRSILWEVGEVVSRVAVYYETTQSDEDMVAANSGDCGSIPWMDRIIGYEVLTLTTRTQLQKLVPQDIIDTLDKISYEPELGYIWNDSVIWEDGGTTKLITKRYDRTPLDDDEAHNIKKIVIRRDRPICQGGYVVVIHKPWDGRLLGYEIEEI